MLKKTRLQDALGSKLAHDITEIRPGEFKGPAFRKDHTVYEEDLCRLQGLGKNHLYLIDLAEDEIHENEAAAILAGAGEIHYGAAALPGAMLLVAYLGEVPLLGVPACALHHRITVLDLILPRILAGEPNRQGGARLSRSRWPLPRLS